MIGFNVKSIAETRLHLAIRGLRTSEPLLSQSGDPYVRIHDPDGRLVILTEGMEERGPDNAI